MRRSDPRHLTPTAARVCAAAVVTIACGVIAAGAATAAASPHRSGKAKLVARADAICLRVNQQSAPYQMRINKLARGKHPNYTRMAAALKQSVGVEQHGLNQLRALSAPAGDQTTVAKVWDQLGTIVESNQAISAALRNSNITAVNQASQRRAGAETVYHRLAQAFGFKYCGASSAS